MCPLLEHDQILYTVHRFIIAECIFEVKAICCNRHIGNFEGEEEKNQLTFIVNECNAMKSNRFVLFLYFYLYVNALVQIEKERERMRVAHPKRK